MTILVILDDGRNLHIEGVKKVGFYPQGFFRKASLLRAWDFQYKIISEISNITGWRKV